jgi:hypothetical protein
MECHFDIPLFHFIYTNLGKISLAVGGIFSALHVLYYLLAKNIASTLPATIAKVTGGAALAPALMNVICCI